MYPTVVNLDGRSLTLEAIGTGAVALVDRFSELVEDSPRGHDARDAD
ncbi:MAG: hypothetical protein L0H25_10100 [Micrococcales bacterium]|nr:hypothetical protein [Micrococcales bacterium]